MDRIDAQEAGVATRWEVFHAGITSADETKYPALPQRKRAKEVVGDSGKRR